MSLSCFVHYHTKALISADQRSDLISCVLFLRAHDADEKAMSEQKAANPKG